MSNQTQANNDGGLAVRFGQVTRAGLLPSAPIDPELAVKAYKKFEEEAVGRIPELQKKYPKGAEQE